MLQFDVYVNILTIHNTFCDRMNRNVGEARRCLCNVGERPSVLQQRICRLSEYHNVDCAGEREHLVLPPEGKGYFIRSLSYLLYKASSPLLYKV